MLIPIFLDHLELVKSLKSNISNKFKCLDLEDIKLLKNQEFIIPNY